MRTLCLILDCRHLAVLACALLVAGCGQQPVGAPNIEGQASTASVTVVIDRGEGAASTYPDVDFTEDLTVIGALEKLKPHGVSFEFRGSGATAFVESIGGDKNTGSGKNWIYYVNEKKATVGAGVCILQPDDVVLWKYTDKIE